ncbi:MAG TPA: hypothetical protein VHQ90_00585 [Thermoanaerobaculia bacterium]|nr:hypothetical protein [Thermoanaerobaculia bacterium]
MNGLKRILEEVNQHRLSAGGAISDKAMRALRTYRTRLFATFLVFFVLLVCVVGFGAFGLAWFFKQPAQQAAFAGAMGISVGGALELMRRIWSQWSQAGLLLVLIEDASEAQVATLIDKVIQKL